MFFFNKQKRIDQEIPLIKVRGIFRRQITIFEAIALIVSATIGAGVLGIPYAIAQVGIWIGATYIVGLGILIIGFNLLIGSIAVRTRGSMQMEGIARRYLGRWGEVIMIILRYLAGSGVMVIYMIGVGKSMTVLVGGSSYIWSLAFIGFGAALILYGVKTIKVADFFLSIAILVIVLIIASFGFSHIHLDNYEYNNLAALLLPYGVILFAYAGGPAVLEAHSILVNQKKKFKKTIILAGIINIVTYLIFAVVVLGVTGVNTTEIATIGLGNEIGPIMLLFGNLFAVLAMTTSFLTMGLSLRDSLVWDYKLKGWMATFFISAIPLIIFLLGLRQFIQAVNIVGGVFVSLEMLLIILIYWRAKQVGDLKPGKYKLHHTLLLIVLLIIALTIGAIYSVAGIF